MSCYIKLTGSSRGSHWRDNDSRSNGSTIDKLVAKQTGIAMGLKNWLRITFSMEPSLLEDGLGRIKAFYLRHAKKQ
ncbi:putative aminotransferase TAT2 [Camellia lanceoleosa]|uniref:Aminotransferase TAT2 n=1 Tax=Camellia lanceoleosa TaxID=1840588 RepID=A0ACC0HGI6_9ERIC|nr:putative aminotransferase TAT2 [Camellia lanceoleosa]